ncbi:hypothetical protein EDC01DRAFT_274890 [Geopyxis carbonaria]|nr:hypothetical protein EDC01DRAFT_274890 [Geopyxis carbonaria]
MQEDLETALPPAPVPLTSIELELKNFAGSFEADLRLLEYGTEFSDLEKKGLPYPLITHDDEDCSDAIDVIVVELEKEPPKTCSIESISDLVAYLEALGWQAETKNLPADCSRILVLVEDLTPKLVIILGHYFGIPLHTLMQHTSGAERLQHQRTCTYLERHKKRDQSCYSCIYQHHSNRLHREPDLKLSSISWRSMVMCSVHMCTIIEKLKAAELDRQCRERVAWERIIFPSMPEHNMREPLINKKIHKEICLDCGIFRGCSAISGAETRQYGSQEYTCAMEERITSYTDGDLYGIFLFDSLCSLAPEKTYEDFLKHRTIKKIPIFRRPGLSNEDFSSTSTRSSFQEMLKNIMPNSGHVILPDLIIRAKIQVLIQSFNQWQKIFWEVDIAIYGIIASMKDDVIVQRRLLEWRTLWATWRGLLTEFETSLQISTRWVEGLDERYCMDEGLHELKKVLETAEKKHKRLVSRTKEGFEALMSTISIIDSHAAISEAESISKLTELAFIFVPLSFTTSFFGMNIKEWSSNEPRIFQFWSFALGIILLVYTIRLALRSGFIRLNFGSLRTYVAAAAGIPEGQDIPSRAWYTWARDQRFVRHVVALTPLAIFLALIWSLGWQNPSFRMWHRLLLSNLAVSVICLFVQTFGKGSHALYAGIRAELHRPYRFVLAFVIIVGVPGSLIWTCNSNWPRYIRICGTAAFVFLFHLFYFFFYYLYFRCRITSDLLYLSCALYLIAAPALLIWHGDISAVENWKTPFKIGITFISVLMMTFLTVVTKILTKKMENRELTLWSDALWEAEQIWIRHWVMRNFGIRDMMGEIWQSMRIFLSKY